MAMKAICGVCQHMRGITGQIMDRVVGYVDVCIRGIIWFAVVIFSVGNTSVGQAAPSVNLSNWLTLSANIDGGYRNTQFFLPHYDTGVGQGDVRVELWLPSGRHYFPWGVYGRVAGIIGSEPHAWQNGALAWPGIGLQTYPFRGLLGFLGPVRIFGEYNFMHYWGEDSQGQGFSWRPKNQVRAGFDYWKAINVNDTGRYWWVEMWNGLYWQSSNEFLKHYDSLIFANSGRIGVRKAKSGGISTITPYVAVESSRSKYNYAGGLSAGCKVPPSQDPRTQANPCDFFWENRLLVGGGLRFAPSLDKIPNWLLNRFVIYGEYLKTPTYYGPAAPSGFPRYDWRVGLSASVGKWYK